MIAHSSGIVSIAASGLALALAFALPTMAPALVPAGLVLAGISAAAGVLFGLVWANRGGR